MACRTPRPRGPYKPAAVRRVMVALRLAPDVAAVLRAAGNQGRLVDELVREWNMRINTPPSGQPTD